jgi:hypothetical protein
MKVTIGVGWFLVYKRTMVGYGFSEFFKENA